MRDERETSIRMCASFGSHFRAFLPLTIINFLRDNFHFITHSLVSYLGWKGGVGWDRVGWDRVGWDRVGGGGSCLDPKCLTINVHMTFVINGHV